MRAAESVPLQAARNFSRLFDEPGYQSQLLQML
jgi:hypothetical protein